MARMADLSTERSGLTVTKREKRRKRKEGAYFNFILIGGQRQTDGWILEQETIFLYYDTNKTGCLESLTDLLDSSEPSFGWFEVFEIKV